MTALVTESWTAWNRDPPGVQRLKRLSHRGSLNRRQKGIQCPTMEA